MEKDRTVWKKQSSDIIIYNIIWIISHYTCYIKTMLYIEYYLL